MENDFFKSYFEEALLTIYPQSILVRIHNFIPGMSLIKGAMIMFGSDSEEEIKTFFKEYTTYVLISVPDDPRSEEIRAICEIFKNLIEHLGYLPSWWERALRPYFIKIQS